jgi:hypothetical protein
MYFDAEKRRADRLVMDHGMGKNQRKCLVYSLGSKNALVKLCSSPLKVGHKHLISQSFVF